MHILESCCYQKSFLCLKCEITMTEKVVKLVTSEQAVIE